MSRRIANLAFAAALGLTVTVGLSGVAKAGPSAVCGNSTVEPGEQCDDGNTVTEASSDPACCSFPSCLPCGPSACGDTFVNADIGEQCDPPGPGTGPADACGVDCKLLCGNGAADAGEVCDPGTPGTDTATCDSDCTAPSCGDGHVNEAAGEQCDPPGATCSETCQNIGANQTKGQAGCITAVNGNALGVLKALDKAFGKCLKDIASGKATLTCFATVDTSKAEGKTASTISGKKCTGDNLPTIAFTDATTVNTAAKTAGVGSATIVFGAAPNIVSKSTDKEGAACQAQVSKVISKLQETWLAEANKVKKTALKAGQNSDAGLASAIDAGIPGNAKITKAEGAVNQGIAAKCPDARVDELFDCAGATTGNALALCGVAAAERAACLALEASDGLSLSCPGDS